MKKKLEDQVVVITGASSGIGRATALAFAEEGATVVLAARREEALRRAAEECEGRGGKTWVIPTDVTNLDAVEHLARTAVEQFGRIDVWVNNAAVTLFARFEEAPPEAFRRVFETNVFGYYYGAREALRYFRERGQGVLINVDSVVVSAPQPYTSAYVATKYAIRGMFECLRMELSLDQAPDIHVCTVMPASIDTPFFRQAANYTGRAVQALKPAYAPEIVAEAILKMARSPRRERVVGGAGRLMRMQHAVAPGLYEKTGARIVDQGHFRDLPAEPTSGNLFEPKPEHAAVEGGFRKPGHSHTGKLMVAGAAAAVLVPAAILMARNGFSVPGFGR